MVERNEMAAIFLVACMVALTACGGGTAGNRFTVAVTVSGLTGDGLVLRNNGSDELVIPADGSYAFAAPVADGGTYVVAVSSQPIDQGCEVSGGSGTVRGKDVTDVNVVCGAWTKVVGAPEQATYAHAAATDSAGNVYVAGYTTGALPGGEQVGIEDYFLISYDPAGNRRFVRQIGAPGTKSNAYDVAVAADGSIYVAGQTNGGLDDNAVTGWSMFLSKYDTAGNHLYTRQLGVVGAMTYAHAVTTDTAGNVYVAGATGGGLDGNVLSGTQDLFLAKYDAEGNRLYTRQFGAAGAYVAVNTLALDRWGDIYVGGYTSAGLGGNGQTGSWDMYIVKFDATGTYAYARQIGYIGVGSFLTSLLTDVDGNVIAVGATDGRIDGNLKVGTRDLVIARYSAAGDWLGAQQSGVVGKSTAAHDVATDEAGNIYVTGYSAGDYDGNPLNGTYDLIFSKYDAAGSRLFTRQLGVIGAASYGSAVAVGGDGSAYVAGYTEGDLDGKAAVGGMNMFLVKYGPDGIKR